MNLYLVSVCWEGSEIDLMGLFTYEETVLIEKRYYDFDLLIEPIKVNEYNTDLIELLNKIKERRGEK